MWTSDAQKGVLVVEGEPGVELRILDADFQLQAQGTVRLRQSLQPGLYVINWKSGGELRQQIVRLRRGQTRIVEPPARETRADHRQEVAMAAQDLVPGPSAISAAAHEAEIVVVVDAGETGTTSLGVRLFTRDDVAMRSNSSDLAEAQRAADGGVAVRVYHVDPAVYRLQYEACTGEVLDQSVPAIDGRRTVVFLRSAVGKVMVAQGDELQTVEYQGADPPQSVIITMPRESSLAEAAETHRLARIMLGDLATRRTSLGDVLLSQIEAPGMDPLVRIYAASVILQRLEAGLSPTLEQPTRQAGPGVARRWRWTGRALKLLELGQQEGLPADVEVAAWQARSMRTGSPSRLQALRTPPMLECCWGWAVKRSAVQPDTIPDSFSFRAATNGAVGASPWLIWRTAAAKGAAPEAAPDRGNHLDALLARLANETAKLLNTSAGGAGSDPFARFSPETRTLVAQALQLAPRGLFSSFWHHGLAQKLAQSVHVPAATLQLRAEQALEELTKAVRPESPEIEPPEAGEAITPAPALSRAILVPDDPNKGRFGGQAEVQGFRLAAQFAESDKDWVTITLVVDGAEAKNGQTVEFFLHDSFNPDRYAESFNDGRAELEVYAWGGFTVGAWLPGPGVELELDLALLPDAPRIVREL